jgi:hypothetical protein
VAESFDTTPFPSAPAGWQQWASRGNGLYSISRNFATSGQQALAIRGSADTASRFWDTAVVGGDVTVQGYVLSSAPAPVLLFARGSNLESAAASYVGVTTTDGGAVAVVESVNGVERVVASATPTAKPGETWLHVTLSLTGERAAVRVRRADTGEFLAADGRWGAEAGDAIATTVTLVPGAGLAGLGRSPGGSGPAYVDDFTVLPIAAAPPVSSPTAGQKYSHVRIAELAYDKTPVAAFEKNLAAESVDLVIPNPKYLDTFEEAAPGTAKVLYSNVSNLYQDLLLDWLNYADATGASREAAFYHVAEATASTGSSASAQPVTWLWNVSRGAADGTGPVTGLTSNARADRSVGVTFGGAGEAVSFGFPDRFRELNVTTARGPQAGWAGTWEYAAAVDSAGKPTAWKPLALVSDGTNGFERSGQITFDPPRDWVASAAGDYRLFTVRFRTTAGTAAQAPEAKSVFGRDYVHAKGTDDATIPAFDHAADRDGDGHLNDTEYSRRQTGFDARFVHESRLFYPYYGQMRFVTNPTAAAVKDWAADYHARLLAAEPHADGFFLDNAGGRLPFAGTPVVEATANFTADSAGLIDAMRRRLTGKLVVANTSGGRTEANGLTAAAGAAFEEFLLRPNEANWTQLGDVADTVNQRLAAGDGTAVILDSHPGTAANMTDARTQLGALSYYYLLADPARTYLSIWGGFAPAAAWSKKWIPAAAVNVGKPVGGMTTFAEGRDPQDAKLAYKVFGREYENALVLFKPRSYALGKGTGTTADATATTHDLNGEYRELRADGTLGPAVRQVTLRNGEGAVLVKAA